MSLCPKMDSTYPLPKCKTLELVLSCSSKEFKDYVKLIPKEVMVHVTLNASYLKTKDSAVELTSLLQRCKVTNLVLKGDSYSQFIKLASKSHNFFDLVTSLRTIKRLDGMNRLMTRRFASNHKEMVEYIEHLIQLEEQGDLCDLHIGIFFREIIEIFD